ncbi:hypothetical protein MBRA1_002217 [Malassezia brasiliensis]|uniref:Uncharacterized protein n=1 Tax=Malassezia brasiliensis TaxID=1821822 RepID=A0AAF0IT41_9BASI|nr:hypothetical protein MBRA1_002217 [Malassezia brasiliensis]
MEFPPQHEASAVYAQQGVFDHNDMVNVSEPAQPSVPPAPTEANAGLSATHEADAAPLEPGEEAEPANEETGNAPASSASQAPKPKAAQQNEYLDFLRDVVPMPVPLSTAMQQRAQMAQAGEEQEAPDASPSESSKPADEHEAESDAAMDAEDVPSPSPLPPASAKPEGSHEWSPTPSAAVASSTNLTPSESGGTPVLPTPQKENTTPMDL